MKAALLIPLHVVLHDRCEKHRLVSDGVQHN